MNSRHRTGSELAQALTDIAASPKDRGAVQLIVARPNTGERTILDKAELTTTAGVVGDKWSKSGSGNPECQVTLMNARAIAAIAGPKSDWPPAGDQLYVDLDLSETNLPVGACIRVGSALLEISKMPHTGCKKFLARFGVDAKDFVNSPEGLKMRLRGVNARVVGPGVVCVGDCVEKV